MTDIYTKTRTCLLWLGEEPETPVPAVSHQQSLALDQLLQQTDAFLADFSASLLQNIDSTSPLYQDIPSLFTTIPEIDPKDDFVITKTRQSFWSGDERDAANIEYASLPEVENDSIFHAFALISRLASDCHPYDIPYLQNNELDNGRSYATNARRAAHWLVSRDWWSRVWTAQECILPDDSKIIYGPVEASWPMFLRAFDNFKRHMTTCCSSLDGIADMLDFHLDTIQVLQILNKMRRRKIPCTLEYLLRILRYRRATDPRDNIYALLPLVTDWQQMVPIVPDYQESNTISRLYTKTTADILRAGSNLDILCQPEEGGLDRRDDLPSWVPDFTLSITPAGTLGHFTEQMALYNACLGIPSQVNLIGDKFLVLEGRLVDRVNRASITMPYRNDDQDIRGGTLKWWHEVAQEELGEKNQNWKQEFWRTLCGDTVLANQAGEGAEPQADWESPRLRRACSEDETCLNHWCSASNLEQLMTRELDGQPSSQEDSSTLSYVIKLATRKRRFFTSERGRMGIGPSGTVLTYPTPDEVFVFAGGRSPLVLRQIGVQQIPGIGPRPCHKLLGDCYIHGLMDGEGAHGLESDRELVYLV